jgi:hypothetical protein
MLGVIIDQRINCQDRNIHDRNGQKHSQQGSNATSPSAEMLKPKAKNKSVAMMMVLMIL